ncbi:hypothetical protein pb186bvf_007456 [Paramecium bursaria]
MNPQQKQQGNNSYVPYYTAEMQLYSTHPTPQIQNIQTAFDYQNRVENGFIQENQNNINQYISNPPSNRANYQQVQQPLPAVNQYNIGLPQNNTYNRQVVQNQQQNPQYFIQQNPNQQQIFQSPQPLAFSRRQINFNTQSQRSLNTDLKLSNDRMISIDQPLDQSQVIKIQYAQPSARNYFNCINHHKEITHMGREMVFEGEEIKNQWRLKCSKCQEATFIDNDQNIKLQDFLSDPIEQILYQKNQPNIETLLDSIQKEIKNNLKVNLTEILEQVQQIDIQLKLLLNYQDLKSFLSEKIKFDQFKETIDQFKTQNHPQEQRKILTKQLEDQINQFYSQESAQTYIEQIQRFVIRQQKEIEQHIQSFYQLQQLSQQLFQQVICNLDEQKTKLEQVLSQIIEKVGQQFTTQSLIDDLQEFPTIQYLITKGKSIEYELIYQGSKDGLSCEEYWKRCDLQENLLTIMTSENGNVFGGYSPCILDCSIPQYLQDPSFQSFIFQYNKKQIYKLKNQQYAVYANRDYGPTYGNGHDLTINSDFQYGSTSNFGMAYDTTNYQISDKYTHLFGDFNPKLVECKVYRIEFI